MPTDLFIEDLDDGTFEAILQNSTAEGVTVEEYLRRVVTRAARRPRLDGSVRPTASIRPNPSGAQIMNEIDEIRGPWPESQA